MKTSKNGIALIKKFEGCRLKSYQDQVGVWTIGYGITSSVGYGPILAGMTITQETADKWLMEGLASYEAAVNKALTRPANQNQFDALASLCWNIGKGGLTRSSVVSLHNAGDYHAAADAFLMWVKAGGKVNKGLTNRRQAERALYLSPTINVNAPTAPIHVDAPVVQKTDLTALQPRVSAWAGIIQAIIGLLARFKRK
jgi:GH24 family phage-related lysozyme (muramidase)